MKTLTHAIAMIAAGVLAFAAVFAAYLITQPLVSGSGTHAAESDSAAEGEQHDASELPAAPLDRAMLGRWQAPEPANPDAFVEFTQYGLWFSSDGCNGLNGSWSAADDGSLRIDGTEAMTLIACDNEPIPTAVRYAVSAEITPEGELVLVDAEGERTSLVQTRPGSIALEGRWVPEQSTGASSVAFAADGTWEGSDGCNTASGSWALSAADATAEADADGAHAANPFTGRLEIGDLSPMTRMACEDLDSVNLPLLLADAAGLEFTDQHRATLLVAAPDAEEWEFVQLVRAEEAESVDTAP